MIDERFTNEFLNLIDDNKKLIYKVCQIYCDSVIDRNDIFQEIIINLWKAYPRFKGESKISSWIYKIALNTSVTWLRDYQKQKHVEYTIYIPSVSDDNELERMYEELYSAIAHLGKIDINSDTAIQSLHYVVMLKSISNNLNKSVLFYYPILYSGIILMCWNSLDLTLSGIIFIGVFFAVTYYLNIWGNRKYKDRIRKLEKDIIELKEYLSEV